MGLAFFITVVNKGSWGILNGFAPMAWSCVARTPTLHHPCGDALLDFLTGRLPITCRLKSAIQARYQQTHPEGLATAEELRALGLRPGTSEPDAILEYVHGDRSGMCGLFERGKAELTTAERKQPQLGTQASTEKIAPEDAG